MPVSLYREKYPEAFRSLRLAARRELAPDFWRVRLSVPDGADPSRVLARYRAPGAGDHGRVYVGRAADDWVVPVDEAGTPTSAMRVETVVAHSVEEGWIDLDLLVHRDADGRPAGLIGPWVVDAPPGSPAIVADPKGSVLMRGAPEAWVLAGDDTAVPAIRRYLAALSSGDADAAEGRAASGSRGLMLLETRYALEALELDVPAGVEVRILEPRDAPSAALAGALEALPRPLPAPDAVGAESDVLLFACAEQSIVTAARRVLARWNIDPENAVAKGYWKRGA